MKILPISQPNYTINRILSRPIDLSGFNRSIDLSSIEKIGKTIRKNPKTSGIIAAGALLIGAAIYGVSKLIERKKTSQNVNNNSVENLIKENPKRLEYIDMLGNYSRLSDAYYKFMSDSANNPEDNVKKNLLGIFELILEKQKDPKTVQDSEHFLQVLEQNYSEDMENICTDFYTHVRNKGSAKIFFQTIDKRQISPSDLALWTKYPNFNLKELQSAKILPEKAIDFLNTQKAEGNIKTFLTDKKEDAENYYFYTFIFPKNKTLKEKFQTIVKMHKIIYGPIHLNRDERVEFTKEDVENELYDRLRKDKLLDSVYNLVKYLNPSALEGYNYSSKEVKLLPERSKRYRKLREDLGRGIVGINLDSPRVKELLDVINDENMPKDILSNGHATIRFISRFVLKDNYNPDLKKDTDKKIQMFRKELEQRFESNVKISRYKHKYGHAPCFYLGINHLGEYIKITLNKEGEIHTLYESTQRIIEENNIE